MIEIIDIILPRDWIWITRQPCIIKVNASYGFAKLEKKNLILALANWYFNLKKDFDKILNISPINPY